MQQKSRKLQSRKNILIIVSCFLFWGKARIVFKIQWRRFKVSLTVLGAVEMHQTYQKYFKHNNRL